MQARAQRALENFGSDPAITAAAFRKYKFALSYSSHSEFMADVAKLVVLPAQGDADMLRAQDILRHWDGMTNVADRGTALAELAVGPVITAERTHEPAVSLAASLKQAIATLKTHFGRLDPEWGRVNRIVRGKWNLPIDGGLDIYRAVYGDLQPDGTLKAEPVMDVQAVADAVLYMAGLPLSANVQFMTVMATQMPFIGRG